MVSHLEVLGAVRVGQTNKEFASRERVKVVVGVSLDPLLVPDLGLFTLSVYLCDNLIEVRLGIHSLPERLTVLGVVTTAIVLLGAIVDEGDTTTGQGEYNSVA